MDEGNTSYIILHPYFLKSQFYFKSQNTKTEIREKILPFFKVLSYSWQPDTEICVQKAELMLFPQFLPS